MNSIYQKVSKELGFPVEVVKKAYECYWEFIRKTIQELPLKEDLSEEEFKKLKTNFNIVSLGKLSCTYDRYLRMKETLKYKKSRSYESKKSKTIAE